MGRFISAAFVLLACSHSVPVGYTTTTTAPFIDNSSALSSIAYARCTREAACNEVGENKKHASFETCADELEPRAKICVLGFQAERLDACLTGIRNERCDVALDDIERVPACHLLCATR